MHITRSNDISSTGDTIDPTLLKPDAFDRQQDVLLQQQDQIDKYNKGIGNIHPSFTEKELTGSRVIVRLFKHDAITPMLGSLAGIVMRKDMKIKIPNKSRTGTVWVTNPFPYMYQGIICQVPENKQFTENFSEFVGKEGHVVDLEFIQFGSKIYYPDKRFVDPMIPDEEVESGVNPVPNFQGYIVCFPNEITHIHKAKVELNYTAPKEEAQITEHIATHLDTWRKSQASLQAGRMS